jgi:cyclic pyranopterin phosphate synthase
MFDRFERPITYLRISVTDRCSLRCLYCVPAEGAPHRPKRALLTAGQIADAARAAVGLGVRKIRLTGGEPLMRRDIVDIVRVLAAIDGLEHLAMTTNAVLLSPLAAKLREAGLGSVNVSLCALDPARYRELTRVGDFHEALAGLRAALDAGFPVKVNMVVFNDTSEGEISRMKAFCASLGARLQLIDHFELSERKKDRSAFDRPPSCDDCDRIRLTADGMLKPCLHSDEEVRLDPRRPEQSLREAILLKPRRGGACTNRLMSQIGG